MHNTETRTRVKVTLGVKMAYPSTPPTKCNKQPHNTVINLTHGAQCPLCVECVCVYVRVCKQW